MARPAYSSQFGTYNGVSGDVTFELDPTYIHDLRCIAGFAVTGGSVVVGALDPFGANYPFYYFDNVDGTFQSFEWEGRVVLPLGWRLTLYSSLDSQSVILSGFQLTP